MAKTRDLKGRLAIYKRRYRKTLQEMLLVIQAELEGLEDDIFKPSSAVESIALNLIQDGNRLRALLEVEEE